MKCPACGWVDEKGKDLDRDIHTETAARLFGVEFSKVTKLQRFFAKKINFGVPYGTSGMGMATQLRMMGILDWDDAACDKFIGEWKKLYSTATAWMESVKSDVRRTGYVVDHWGMRRYLPGIWAYEQHVREEAGREAVNHVIQGTAQGMIQNSMAWLWPQVRELQPDYDIRWALQVHDSIMFVVEEEISDVVETLAIEALTEHGGLEMRVPTLAEASRAKTWGGL